MLISRPRVGAKFVVEMAKHKKKENGNCGFCRMVVKTSDESILCEKCQLWFHVRCQPEGISSQLYHHIMQMEALKSKLNAPDCCQILWYCEGCSKDRKKKSNDLAEIKDVLVAQKAALNDIVHAVRQRPSYAQVTGHTQTKPQSQLPNTKNMSEGSDEIKTKIIYPRMTITPTQQQDSTITLNDFKNMLQKNVKKKLTIENTFVEQNGTLKVQCANLDVACSVEECLTNEFQGKYVVKKPKMLKPKLKLVGLSPQNHLSDNDLIESVRNLNNLDLMDDIELAVVKRYTNGKTNNETVVLEVSRNVFDDLVYRDRVHCGLQMVHCYEYINVRKCGNCASVNHNTLACKCKGKVCRKCGGEGHLMAECTHEPNCINCSDKAKFLKIDLDVKHSAHDPNCKSYLDIVQSIRSRIQY